MNCWHCDRPASGVCRFCGRALCKDHVQTMPFVLAAFTDAQGKQKAVAVKDVLFCGTCEPQPGPVALEGAE